MPDSKETVLPLAGGWCCALDPSDEGIGDRWFQRALEQAVHLPGLLAAQGLGHPVSLDTPWTGTIFDRAYFDAPRYAAYREPGNIKLPFWLQPETHYLGTAWYQRQIEIPLSWAGKRVVLFLERPHWQTRVWLDEREMAAGDSLSTPHEIDLGSPPEGRHRLTIRVDNRLHIDVGENAHSVSDHTQGNWNGIVGRIELRATERSWIDRIDVFPQVASCSVRVRGTLGGPRASGEVTLRVRLRGAPPESVTASQAVTPSWTHEGGAFEAELFLGAEASLWDEFDPVLYELEADFAGSTSRVLFGLREFTVEGTQFAINGRKVFLRGALDCAVFPLTGHPPTEVEPWRAMFCQIQAHGLNHLRFHSWCPPEAAFMAADELGLYLQVECAVWPNAVAVLAFNSPAGIGDGAAVDDWAYAEGERILRVYGNHPSFVLMACGNEPGGPHHEAYLSRWVSYFRERDPRRLYTGAAGWPELPGNDFHVLPGPRLHQWGEGLESRLNALPPATTHDHREHIGGSAAPVISHEIGQWCAYPPVYDAGKYSGYLKARNYEIFAASLAANHLADQARAFVHASGKLQALCYKEEIEASLRTPGMGGFQLLGLQDFPGQGTAPVGVLDAFWEDKGYLAAAEMRRFCAPTVPLARLPKRVFTTDEHLEAAVEVAHFGPAPLAAALSSWELRSEEGNVVRRGAFPARDISPGNAHELGRLELDLTGLAAPARYRLSGQIQTGAGAASAANDWDIWLYPAHLDLAPPPALAIRSRLSEVLPLLAAGRTVLFIPPREGLSSEVALGFSPIFWNTSCTQGQPPHTLGILCDPAHPALAGFPTEGHSNWQWWYLIQRASALVLDALPPELRPIVQVVDDWFTNRRLGLLFEARVGAGRLLVSSIDLLAPAESAEDRAVSGQFLRSLMDYAASTACDPAVSLTPRQLERLFPAP